MFFTTKGMKMRGKCFCSPNRKQTKTCRGASTERMVNLTFLKGYYKQSMVNNKNKGFKKKDTKVLNGVLLNIYFAAIWRIICSI